MALETLIDSQWLAAQAMDNPDYFSTTQELQHPHVHRGDVDIPGLGMHDAFRAHSGPERLAIDPTIVLIYKGGVRFYRYSTLAVAEDRVQELAVEMNSKVNLWGYSDYRGGKGLVVVDADSLDHVQKLAAAEGFERFMQSIGAAGYNIDVPAGDIGTNGLSDAYVLEYHRNNPDDPYWRATATGKSIHGADERPEATGLGTYVTQRTIMNAYGEASATSSVQGFGNVGAWYACSAYEDRDPDTNRPRVTIPAISDVEGMLFTNHPDGIQVTREMVMTIVEDPNFLKKHPEFRGSKLAALKHMAEARQPGVHINFRPTRAGQPDDILSFPADYFVPAAIGNVITDTTAQQLGARRGVIEAANGPTTLSAHRHLIGRGLLMAPDIMTNGLGVHTSILEHKRNIATVEGREFNFTKADLITATERTVRHVLDMRDKLGEQDLRIAAAAASMAVLLTGQGVAVDAAFVRQAA